MSSVSTDDTMLESLRVEMDGALHHAAKRREELRRLVDTLRERTRRRQVLARAEALVPSFRAELMRRAQELQRGRGHLLQTLRRFADRLLDGDLLHATDGDADCHGSLLTVWRALRQAMRAEEDAATWKLLPLRGAAWRDTRMAALTACTAASAASTQSTSKGGVAELEMVVEKLLGAPATSKSRTEKGNDRTRAGRVNENEEEEDDGATENGMSDPEVEALARVPCFCTMAQFFAVPTLSVVPMGRKESDGHTPGNSNNNNHNVGFNARRLDSTAVWGSMGDKREVEREGKEEEDGVEGEAEVSAADGEFVRSVLHAVAADMDRLDTEAEELEKTSEGTQPTQEESEALETVMEETRLRVSLERTARAVACRLAVDSLMNGEDNTLFDGIVYSGGLPTLVLPPMEQLFFSAAYTIGAAIVRDEARERRNGVAVAMDVDHDTHGGADEKEEYYTVNNSHNSGEEDGRVETRKLVGWRGVLNEWVSQGPPLGPQVWEYLLKYVLRPPLVGRRLTSVTSHRENTKVCVAPSLVQRWLTTALRDEKDVNAMMALYVRDDD